MHNLFWNSPLSIRPGLSDASGIFGRPLAGLLIAVDLLIGVVAIQVFSSIFGTAWDFDRLGLH